MATNIIKCNHCKQWTASDKYSCNHCGEIIEEERIKATKTRHEQTSLSFDNIMLVKIYEDDHIIIKFFKKIFQVAQLIYIAVLTFVLWLIALLPGLLRHPIFLVSLVLFAINWCLERFAQIHIPYIHAYMDDLLCMPVVLTIALWVQRYLVFRNPRYVFNFWHILFAILYFSVMFELILPSYSKHYTADYWDILAYGLGAVFFFKFLNK